MCFRTHHGGWCLGRGAATVRPTSRHTHQQAPWQDKVRHSGKKAVVDLQQSLKASWVVAGEGRGHVKCAMHIVWTDGVRFHKQGPKACL